MLFYEYEPRTLVELVHLRDLASRVRRKFDAGVSVEELLLDVELMQNMLRALKPLLPGDVSVATLDRHLHFLG